MQLFVDPRLLVGFSLALTRAAAWVTFCPPFNGPAMPVRVRIGMAVALAFVLAGPMGAQVDTELAAIGGAEFVGMLFTQVLAGVVLGYFVAALFTVVQTAGELIDLQVGFSMGAVIDPISGNNSSPIGRFYQLMATAVLFAINGHVLVVGAFVRSVEVAPLGRIDIEGAIETFARLLGILLVAALEIALPVLAALFCAELALGFLGKAAPQLNILVIGFAAKAFITFGLLGATLLLLPETVDSLLGSAIRSAFGVFGG